MQEEKMTNSEYKAEVPEKNYRQQYIGWFLPSPYIQFYDEIGKEIMELQLSRRYMEH